MRLWKHYKRDETGGVSVEAALLSGVMLMATIMMFEAGWAFFQWNKAQQAARLGGRLAATINPVARDLTTMTGLGGGVEAGDPMPDYTRSCFGKTQSCDQGSFDQAALNMIFYGPDNDGICAPAPRQRRGLCDVYSRLTMDNIDITYASSGLGRAGSPADPAPLITITLKDIRFDFAILDRFTPTSLTIMPPVRVSVMGEDLRSGS